MSCGKSKINLERLECLRKRQDPGSKEKKYEIENSSAGREQARKTSKKGTQEGV